MLHLPLESHIKLFADNSKLFNLFENYKNIQNDLDLIADWCKTNKMPINTDKTVFIRFGNSRCPSSYSIDSTFIKQVDVTKDLGVLFDKKLSFNEHCSTIIKKSNFAAYNILRLFKFCDLNHKYFLFKTYVLPILLYNIELYYPTSKIQKIKLKVCNDVSPSVYVLLV